MELDLEEPPALYYTCEDSMFDNIFDIESQHMPSNSNHIDPVFRQQAMSLILSSHKDLDPFVTYLAINYLDRFLSTGAIQVRTDHEFRTICWLMIVIHFVNN